MQRPVSYTHLTYFSLLFDGIISLFSYHYLAFRIRQKEKKSRVRKETKEFAEKQELEFSDAPSMDESTEPEDLQQTTDNACSTGAVSYTHLSGTAINT